MNDFENEIEIITDYNGVSDILSDVQEQSENLSEQIEETNFDIDIPSSGSSDFDIDIQSDNNEMELEELLRQYFSDKLSSSETSSDDSTELGSVDPEEEFSRDGSISGNSSLDYSDILSDLFDVSSDAATNSSSILGMMEDYNDNNNIQADINDISLSNMLLLLLFISGLFTCVVSFGRRIF